MGSWRAVDMTEETQPKQQIPGYQILAKLGSGGMATVYKAKQLSLDRIVAIKVLPRESTTKQDFIDRFYAEGKAAGKLNHPNIVGALDVGHAGEFHYFVMEYVEGHTVFDEIQDNTRLDEEEAIKIILETARGLEHAHKAGLIHRDVKPQNIMITKDGTAKLADLGLARVANAAEIAEEEEGVTFGSPYYMSPEQILARPDIDFRTDIYSLGATFYYMVTGRVPFSADNPGDVMKMHLRDRLVLPQTLNPKISDGVNQVIKVCMAKPKDQRYDQTSDLVEDLEALKAGEAPLHAEARLGVGSFREETATEEAPADAGKKGKRGKRKTLSLKSSKKTSSSGMAKSAPEVPIYRELSFFPAIVGWLVAIVLFFLWFMKA